MGAEGPEGVAAQERMVGLDCEMCTTSEGLELTRITIVDADMNVSTSCHALSVPCAMHNRLLTHGSTWALAAEPCCPDV